MIEKGYHREYILPRMKHCPDCILIGTYKDVEIFNSEYCSRHKYFEYILEDYKYYKAREALKLSK